MYVHTYVSIYISTYLYIHLTMHMYFAYLCVYIYVCMYTGQNTVFICMYLHMYPCIYISMCVCMQGITLVSTVATALYRMYGRDVPFAFNRKEAKDHGEGGVLVGASVEVMVVVW